MPLAFESVTYRYSSDIAWPALSDVNLTIDDGQFVCVIGHTGSGKSTLAEHTNGTKLPTQGRVVVNGLCTSDKKSRREIRRQVGLVCQYPEYQLFADTVAADVGFGPRNMGLSEHEVDAAVHEALELVGLAYDDVADVSPFDLSGGQKRRVALAGIIAMHPRFLTLDEPMVGLDPRGRRGIFDIVKELHSLGTAIIMVTHSMDDVAEAAERVVVLDRGVVVDEGSPATVFSHGDLLHAKGLDVPRAAHVAADLAERGFALPGETPLTLEALSQAIAAGLGKGAVREG